MCTAIGAKRSVNVSPSLLTRRPSPITLSGRPPRAGTVIFAFTAYQPELTAITYSAPAQVRTLIWTRWLAAAWP